MISRLSFLRTTVLAPLLGFLRPAKPVPILTLEKFWHLHPDPPRGCGTCGGAGEVVVPVHDTYQGGWHGSDGYIPDFVNDVREIFVPCPDCAAWPRVAVETAPHLLPDALAPSCWTDPEWIAAARADMLAHSGRWARIPGS